MPSGACLKLKKPMMKGVIVPRSSHDWFSRIFAARFPNIAAATKRSEESARHLSVLSGLRVGNFTGFSEGDGGAAGFSDSMFY